MHSCKLNAAKAVHCTLENDRPRRFVSSFLFNHVLEAIVTYRKFVKLLRIDDTSIHLYIYICFTEHCPRSIEITCLLKLLVDLITAGCYLPLP